jgi:hypothetical protein
MRSRFLLVLLVVLVGAALLGRALWDRFRVPPVSERQVREAVHAALHREADTTFVVTGYLEITATARVDDTRVLFPTLLPLSLGTTRATVRVPGRASYGFDVSELRPEMIRVRGDTVELSLPRLRVYSVEPDLERLQVETSTGWARHPVTAHQAERRAIQHLNQALYTRAQAHLGQSVQPRLNTANTLEALLRPVLHGIGMRNPTFRVRVGEGMVVETDSPPEHP